ncbi:hypothetical protein L596_021973 [Steinernema carpocapsae]|uniref:Uncharacterized protein n=1 Tax=Steinernema carpocapsae TaxID=34508 RepID=A0A4U5MKD9_STECR|nr:hypothetical protein L596_021973 [Steinernema carpocapsae]
MDLDQPKEIDRSDLTEADRPKNFLTVEEASYQVQKAIHFRNYTQAAVILNSHAFPKDVAVLIPDLFSSLVLPYFFLTKMPRRSLQIYENLSKELSDLFDNTDTYDQMLHFLDTCLAKTDFEKDEVVSRYPNLSRSIIYKVMNSGKELITQMTRKKDLSILPYPNMCRMQAITPLLYRYQKWKDGELDTESYEDNCRYAMTKSSVLQHSFIDKMIEVEDYHEASKWTRFGDFYKNMDMSIHPYDLLDLESKYAQSFTCPTRPTETSYNFKGYKVHFVAMDTPAQILTLASGLKNSAKNTLVTIAFQHQANYFTPGNKKHALLLFSANKQVYIIDCLSMGSEDETVREAWAEFLQVLFGTFKFKKFGQDLKDFQHHLSVSFRPYSNKNMSRGINLQDFIYLVTQELQFKELMQICEEYEGQTLLGVKTILETLFGTKDHSLYDRSQKYSCFEQRPLRRAQMDAAAQQVINLHQIYEKLKQMAYEKKGKQGVEIFHECVNRSETLIPSVLMKKGNRRQKILAKPPRKDEDEFCSIRLKKHKYWHK